MDEIGLIGKLIEGGGTLAILGFMLWSLTNRIETSVNSLQDAVNKMINKFDVLLERIER